ncbi:MAG: hypothetical protein NDJ90_07810 [Oligoflexia bacterium]|nr:hypothetical protein [Oligoflexia bacterium]
MARCECCGNEYDKTMRIEVNGRQHDFDCFECAIHKLAPVCEHCGAPVIGHGVETESMIFCSAHCSRAAGKTGLRDRLPPVRSA